MISSGTQRYAVRAPGDRLIFTARVVRVVVRTQVERGQSELN
jgi:hypothetical protein